MPKWITLPPGLTRADVSITMNYYVKPWGSSATFILKDTKGQVLEKVDGKVKGLEPFHLKHSPPGSAPGYPSYELITVNGITDIIEHRKLEPIFYITDDPAVWKELGVEGKSKSAKLRDMETQSRTRMVERGGGVCCSLAVCKWFAQLPYFVAATRERRSRAVLDRAGEGTCPLAFMTVIYV